MFFIFIYLFIFDVDHFKVYYFLQFYVWNFWPQGMWDPSSPTRDQTHTLCIGKQSHNNWTAKEILNYPIFDDDVELINP